MSAYQFRRSFIRDKRLLAVLDKVASVGKWGRPMPPGTAQGIAIHNEYKSRGACLVEIDCRPATVNRKIKEAFTGPRVTKAVMAVDVGLPINPLGLEAQMIGGLSDGIAQALTYSLHLQNGHYLHDRAAGRRRRARRRPVDGGGGLRLRPGHRHGADHLPHQPQRPDHVQTDPANSPVARVAHQWAKAGRNQELTVP